MARRLEKDALQGAFARGPKPELEFLVPAAPAGAPPRRRKAKAKSAPAPAEEPSTSTQSVEPAPAPALAPALAPAPAPAPAPGRAWPSEARPQAAPPGGDPSSAQHRDVSTPALALPPWSPAAPALSRPGLRARLERGWDALLRRLLIGALGACG